MRRLFWLLTFLLAGCAPTIEQHAADCTAYGYQPGTLEHATCVEGQVGYARAQAAAMSQAMFGAGMALQQQSAQPQYRPWIAPPVGSAQPVWLAN